jgi:hypothetical protein
LGRDGAGGGPKEWGERKKGEGEGEGGHHSSLSEGLHRSCGPTVGRGDLVVGQQVVLHDVVEEDDPEAEPGVKEEAGDGVAIELARGEADLGDVGDGPGVLVRAELRKGRRRVRGEPHAPYAPWAGSRKGMVECCQSEGRSEGRGGQVQCVSWRW